MAIRQEFTKWVKKPGKKGYVIDTRTGKKVTGKIKLVADTTKGKAGESQSYKKGRGQAVARKATAQGSGQMPGRKPSGPSTTSDKTPPPTRPRLTAAERAAKAKRSGRRVAATAGRAANIMAQEKRGPSTRLPARPTSASASAPSKPNVGDERTVYVQGKRVKQVYSVKGWINKGEAGKPGYTWRAGL